MMQVFLGKGAGLRMGRCCGDLLFTGFWTVYILSSQLTFKKCKMAEQKSEN
jgi:hypothetical protein